MSEPELKAGERIEDLQYKGLRIIQSESGFRFGTDSVLLAGFVTASKKDRVIDLGTGTGVLAILIKGRTGADMTAVELQPEQCDMARRSFEMNGQDIKLIEGDMRELSKTTGTGAFDVAVCNPPYYSAEAGKLSNKGSGIYVSAATHEIYCDFGSVAKCASELLKFGGKLFMCCPAQRLAEVLFDLKQNKLEPKRIMTVASVEGKPPYLVLIEAKKGASPGMKWEKQLNVCNKDGAYTEETNRIYHRNGYEQADE